MDVGVGYVVVGRSQIIVLQILTFQPERINYLACAQINRQRCREAHDLILPVSLVTVVDTGRILLASIILPVSDPPVNKSP